MIMKVRGRAHLPPITLNKSVSNQSEPTTTLNDVIPSDNNNTTEAVDGVAPRNTDTTTVNNNEIPPSVVEGGVKPTRGKPTKRRSRKSVATPDPDDGGDEEYDHSPKKGKKEK